MRISKCSRLSLSLCGERMTVKRCFSVGRGIGPRTVACVRSTVSTIFFVDWSMTSWSYAFRRMRIFCFSAISAHFSRNGGPGVGQEQRYRPASRIRQPRRRSRPTRRHRRASRRPPRPTARARLFDPRRRGCDSSVDGASAGHGSGMSRTVVADDTPTATDAPRRRREGRPGSTGIDRRPITAPATVPSSPMAAGRKPAGSRVIRRAHPSRGRPRFGGQPPGLPATAATICRCGCRSTAGTRGHPGPSWSAPRPASGTAAPSTT